MNDARNDEVDGGQVAELYRETRRGIEPPAWLDEGILNAARAAVEPPKTSVAARPRRRGAHIWAVPMALAATVVLMVGLVHRLQISESLAPLERQTTSSLIVPAAEEDAARSSRRQSQAADQIAPSAAPLPPLSAVPPLPASPAAPVGSLQMAPKAAPGKPAALSPEPSRVRALPVEREEQKSQMAPAERQLREEPHRAAPALQQKRMKDEKADRRDQSAHRSPAEWLAEIAKLRRQGRIAEAKASWAEFRRQYPNYPVDKALELPP